MCLNLIGKGVIVESKFTLDAAPVSSKDGDEFVDQSRGAVDRQFVFYGHSSDWVVLEIDGKKWGLWRSELLSVAEFVPK